ncbi:(4Fe-4S)-binding protein, partial [bacterium]|nr:(4Fe-4S)-binding protein [bacterium]
HDLRLAVEMCRTMNRPILAVINRSDLGDERTEEYLNGEGIGIIARLPFQRKVADAYAAGRLAYEYSPELKDAVKLLAGEVHHGR